MAICSVLDILFIILSKFSKVCLEVSMWNWHFDWHGICYNFLYNAKCSDLLLFKSEFSGVSA